MHNCTKTQNIIYENILINKHYLIKQILINYLYLTFSIIYLDFYIKK